MEFNPFKRAEKFAAKFENKTSKVIAFYGAVVSLISLLPIIAGFVYKSYTVVNHVLMIDEHVTNFTEVSKYLIFQVGQNTRRLDSEHDAKMSFGVPVRMSNPPKGTTQGDLWYTTYTKIGDKWYIVTYKAAPNFTDENVDVFDYNGEWVKAGEEEKPNKKDIKAN
jgi:hypothetical protein